jgi:cell shape-determining protein MreC
MYIILFILAIIVIVLLILIRERVNFMDKMRNIGSTLMTGVNKMGSMIDRNAAVQR